MQSTKRIEIIADTILMNDLINALDSIGVKAYTLVRNVTGRGERGLRSCDDPAGVSSNSILLTTCPAERIGEVIETIRPHLKSQGGICLVSDAQWLIH